MEKQKVYNINGHEYVLAKLGIKQADKLRDIKKKIIETNPEAPKIDGDSIKMSQSVISGFMDILLDGDIVLQFLACILTRKDSKWSPAKTTDTIADLDEYNIGYDEIAGMISDFFDCWPNTRNMWMSLTKKPVSEKNAAKT